MSWSQNGICWGALVGRGGLAGWDPGVMRVVELVGVMGDGLSGVEKVKGVLKRTTRVSLK